MSTEQDMQDKTSDPNIGAYKRPVPTIGEEFVNWAEQYWRLEQQYSETVRDPSTKGHPENCPYSIVRKAFIEKINEAIKIRFESYM